MTTALGNIIGGGLFCAGVFWYLHLEGEPPCAIDGVYWESVNGNGSAAPNSGVRFRHNAGKRDEEVGEVANVGRWEREHTTHSTAEPTGTTTGG